MQGERPVGSQLIDLLGVAHKHFVLTILKGNILTAEDKTSLSNKNNTPDNNELFRTYSIFRYLSLCVSTPCLIFFSSNKLLYFNDPVLFN